jgi:hypothetical protein
VECRSGAAYPDLSFSGSTRGELTVTIPLSLSAGNYSINIGARGINGLLEYIPSAASIEILPNPSEQVESWKKPSAGVLITPSDWKISDESTTMNFKTYTSVKE